MKRSINSTTFDGPEKIEEFCPNVSACFVSKLELRLELSQLSIAIDIAAFGLNSDLHGRGGLTKMFVGMCFLSRMYLVRARRIFLCVYTKTKTKNQLDLMELE